MFKISAKLHYEWRIWLFWVGVDREIENVDPISKFQPQLWFVIIWKYCFKLHQNQNINEEFNFWGVKGGGREGGLSRFEKFLKSPYRMVVPLHTESFSTLAQLESVYKSGDLIRHLRGLISSSLPRKEGDPISKIRKCLIQNSGPNPHWKF